MQPGKSQNIPITRQELRFGNKRRLITRLSIQTTIDSHEKGLEVQTSSPSDEVRLPLVCSDDILHDTRTTEGKPRLIDIHIVYFSEAFGAQSSVEH